jgi:hypothetical protein
MVQVEYCLLKSVIDEEEIHVSCSTGPVSSLAVNISSLCFHRLWSLNVSRIGLENLSGITEDSFPSLRFLFSSFNHISDLDPLLGHSRLEVIDLEGNRITHKSNFIVISTLPALKELNLKDNPIQITSQTLNELQLNHLSILSNENHPSLRPVSTASTDISSQRPSTAREIDEISLVLNQARRPSSAKEKSTFLGNPLSLIRSAGLTHQPSHSINRRPSTVPVKIFPIIKKSF